MGAGFWVRGTRGSDPIAGWPRRLAEPLLGGRPGAAVDRALAEAVRGDTMMERGIACRVAHVPRETRAGRVYDGPMSHASKTGPHAVSLTADHEQKLRRYAALLSEEGERLGLLGPNERERVWERHILDSLACAEWVDPSASVRVADLGSGPGLPGIPVAVARPLARICLIESRHRRCSWAQHAVETLGLPVETLCERAEDAARGELRGAFDVVLSRAFASVSVLLECSLPLLAVGGSVVALRGRPSRDEAETARGVAAILGGESPEWFARSPATASPGAVLIVQKTAETPEGFPRRPGVLRKSPLRARPDSGTMPTDPGEAPHG